MRIGRHVACTFHVAFSIVIIVGGFFSAALADSKPMNAKLEWRDRVAPSRLVLELSPSRQIFHGCDEVSFKIDLTNRSPEPITFDRGSFGDSEISIHDSTGRRIAPTGASGIINSSIAFVKVASGKSADLGGISLKEIPTPFSRTDCPPGAYTASLRLNLFPGSYMVKSNVATFAIK